VKAGMTTDDIDKIAHNHIISLNAFPSSIGFIGFPKSISTSVNEVICNGIPSLRPLDEGDTLNIACTLYYNGVFGSSNMMVKIGKPHTDISKLIHIS
jgi:methionyl aminopeptidase